MARPLRVDIPGGFHHVTSRGLERRESARDDADRGEMAGFARRRGHARPLAGARLGADDESPPPVSGDPGCRSFGRGGAEALGTRGTHGNDARAVAIRLCRKLAPTSMVVVGRPLGGITGQAAGKMARALAERLHTDQGLRAATEAREKAVRENFRLTT